MLEKWISTLDNYIIAIELESCMWAHKFASKSILLLNLVCKLSPTFGCCETRRQEVENTRTTWFGEFMKLVWKNLKLPKLKVHDQKIEVCHMSSWLRKKKNLFRMFMNLIEHTGNTSWKIDEIAWNLHEVVFALPWSHLTKGLCTLIILTILKLSIQQLLDILGKQWNIVRKHFRRGSLLYVSICRIPFVCIHKYKSFCRSICN